MDRFYGTGLAGKPDSNLFYSGLLEACPTTLPGNARRRAAVAKEISQRKARCKFLDVALFADPAWDMLLDLYRAHLSQHRVSITSLAASSEVPMTTAIRWVNALEQKQLILRQADRFDSRRTFVALSPAGLQYLENYFDYIED